MVSFRLKYIANDVGFNDSRSIQLRADAHDAVTIELHHVTDTEIDKHCKRGDLLCTAELQKNPTRKISQWLENSTETLPAGFAEFADDAFHTLAEAIITLLQLLRWRIGHGNARNPVRSFHSFMWSTDNVTWKPVPDSTHVEFDIGIPRERATDELVASVHDLWRNNVVEPLAHELFQEAWSQRKANLKSSLVIGVAAAETGMKQLISKLIPSSAWLVQNTQSPPLADMLEEYLSSQPTMVKIANAPPPPLPKSLIEIIKKAVNLRNQIVHGKAVRLETKSLREILNAVHDLLYIFDLYSGQLWANRHISFETQKAWLKTET